MTLKAKITDPKGFRCAPEGHTVVTFPHGAEVVGQVAKWAVDMGAASWQPAIDAKIIAPTETKIM